MSAVTMKLLIDNNAGKVVYAEAGKDFVDFLIHALVQPVGPTMKKLHSNDVIGSLGNIYKSVEDFDPNLLHSDSIKDLLLNPSAHVPLPVTSHVPLLLPKEITVPLPWPNPESLYTCSIRTSNSHRSCKTFVGDDVVDFSWAVSDVEWELCSICGRDMHDSVTLAYVDPQEGYVKANVPYMVSDDLLVKPLSSDAVFMVLNKLSGEDMACLEEKVVTLDTDKGMELIKASLTSKTVLTDIFLVKKE